MAGRSLIIVIAVDVCLLGAVFSMISCGIGGTVVKQIFVKDFTGLGHWLLINLS